MNNFRKILFIVLLILVVVSLVSCDKEESHIEAAYVEAVANEPARHKEHTHEHQGMQTCCPCGVCHKHDGEHDHEKLSIWSLLLSAVLAITVLISSLHDVLEFL